MNIRRQWGMITRVFLLPLLILASCKKEDAGTFNSAKPSVFQYLSDNKQLTLYQAALKRAGMYNAETFSTGGPFTVFAPVDSALIHAGLTLDSINRYDPQALAMILKYGIANGRLSSSSLLGFYAENLTTQNKVYKPTLVKNYYGIFFNGIPIAPGSSTDLNDGVVHLLQRAALPPVGSLTDVIRQTPDLTLLAAVIKGLNQETKYSTPLVNQYYYVLMGPTDDAFKTFGYPDVASIDADIIANPSKWNALLQKWTYSGTIGEMLFTSSFIGGFARSGSSFTIAADGFTIIAPHNPTPVHIIRPDIVATNGVLQVTDQVLAP